jgi:hypothetical protein
MTGSSAYGFGVANSVGVSETKPAAQANGTGVAHSLFDNVVVFPTGHAYATGVAHGETPDPSAQITQAKGVGIARAVAPAITKDKPRRTVGVFQYVPLLAA